MHQRDGQWEGAACRRTNRKQEQEAGTGSRCTIVLFNCTCHVLLHLIHSSSKNVLHPLRAASGAAASCQRSEDGPYLPTHSRLFKGNRNGWWRRRFAVRYQTQRVTASLSVATQESAFGLNQVNRTFKLGPRTICNRFDLRIQLKQAARRQ